MAVDASGRPQYAWSKALAAALALIAIQTGIGIVMKSAQSNGNYSFSPSACVTISEFCKLVLASIFFYLECWRRSKAEHSHDKDILLPEAGSEEAESIGTHGIVTLADYVRRFREDTTFGAGYGFYVLALGYALINNTIFLCYSVADPGTIQLFKSGGTLMTALVMMTTLGTMLSFRQWASIFVQLAGLILTQYQPGGGTLYSLRSYFVLLTQLLLSASMGVYNQHLAKLDGASLHGNNMVLYSSGMFVNGICYLVTRIFIPGEPGFFTGYNSFSAIMVVVSNVLIGLVITAVYRYADALIKCVASTVATAALLYVSPIMFQTKLGAFVVPGTLLVFCASWVYLSSQPPKQPTSQSPTGEEDSSAHGRLSQLLLDAFHRHGGAILSTLTIITVILVVWLNTLRATTAQHPAKLAGQQGDTVVGSSPLQNVTAMVRWNAAHKERIPLIKKYSPFFESVHMSMPEMMSGQDANSYNWELDQSKDSDLVYTVIAETMAMALAGKPNVGGIFYFHFDVWVDPMQWHDMDMQKIWFPSVPDPPLKCMSNTSEQSWWRWKEGVHTKSMAAMDEVERLNLGYATTPGEWCMGWSDMFYMPRKYFADFILLSEVFHRHKVFLEVAIPTILMMIERTRRQSPTETVVDVFKDCWGSCCASNPSSKDVLSARCGHRFNFLNDEVTNAFFEKIDKSAKTLNA